MNCTETRAFTPMVEAAVVHADKTELLDQFCVCEFLSEMAGMTVFGRHKDGETLAALLDEDGFN